MKTSDLDSNYGD